MNDFESIVFSIGFWGGLIACVLYVLLGQITVRKLRKNPEVKDKLGFEFFSGHDIFHVASALSAPKWFRDIFKRSSLSFLRADYDTLYKYTTRFDRILAKTTWIVAVVSVSLLMLLVILNALGLLD